MASARSTHLPISVQQNSDHSLMLLRAFTWYYLQAKRWHAGRVTGTLFFALAAPIVLFRYPGVADWVGALAGVWVLAGRTILSWLEERLICKAVTIQEEFDVDLFDLEWNENLAGPKSGSEDIHSAAMRIHKTGKLNKLRNWYADADLAPWPLNVLLCQRSSAVWGRRTHFRYAALILGLGISWFMAGLVMAGFAHVTVTGYLVQVFLPSQPAFLDTIDLFRGHLGLSKAKEDLEIQTTNLWDQDAITPGSVTGLDCRAIQDQAYRLRRKGMQIPQIIYKFYRQRDDDAMNAAVARLTSARSVDFPKGV